MGKKRHSPSIQITLASTQVYVNQPLTVSLSASDPDGNLAGGTLTWGDGAANSWTGAPPATLTHTYANPATYQLKAVERDTTGMSGSTTVMITVMPPTPIPPVVPPVTQPILSYPAITDRVVRPKPALPTLGMAGFTFRDPLFGTKMVRVTDQNTASGTSWRSIGGEGNSKGFSLDSTKFVLTPTGGGATVFTLDTTSMAVAKLIDLHLFGSLGVTFSQLDADLIYGFDSTQTVMTVVSYRFSTQTYTNVVTVEQLVPTVDAGGRTYGAGLSSGVLSGVEYLTFIFGGQTSGSHHYSVRLKASDWTVHTILDTQAQTIDGTPVTLPQGAFFLHGTSIDMGGRYIQLGDANALSDVWDVQSGTVTQMTVEPQGHGSLGWGQNINMPDNSDSTETLLRNFSSMGSVTNLISPAPTPADFFAASHPTWQNSVSGTQVPVLTELYRYPPTSTSLNTGPWREWDEEIIAIQTSAGTIVWRFGQHRSTTNDLEFYTNNGWWFWYTPRPNVSQDGKWVVFTSSWEKTLGTDSSSGFARQDVFLMNLLDIVIPQQGPPPPPPNQAGVIAFTASPDHNTTLTSYEVRLRTFSTNALVGSLNIGKPQPDASNICRYDLTAWLSGFTAGDYVISIAAISSTGTTDSANSNSFHLPLQ